MHDNPLVARVLRRSWWRAGADLTAADLRGANLERADLRGAQLYATRLRNADLNGAVLDAETLLPDGGNWSPGTDLTQFTAP